MTPEIAHDIGRSDEQLIVAVQEGDGDAMGVLFARHHGGVYALCVRLGHDLDVADDITQEVFLRVWRYAGTFRGRARFRTWLYRLTYNACADMSRRNRPVPTLASTDLEIDHTESEDLSERNLLLEAALSRLPEAHRAVLVLSRFHGLGYDEIAKIIACSPGAARVRLHRAMNELRHVYFALKEKTA
jgi:RNA polymerase sigma factor (sigma-70 family)